MENQISTLRKSIANQRNELKTIIGKMLTGLVSRHGNVYNLPQPQTLFVDNSSANIKVYTLFNICNIDPDLVVVRKINDCANFNVIRYADMRVEEAVALYDAIKRFGEISANIPTTPKKQMATIYSNLTYKDGKAYIYKNMQLGYYVLLPQDFKINPYTGEKNDIGETGTLRLAHPSLVNISDYELNENFADYIQVKDKQGNIEAVNVYSIEYRGRIYICRLAIDKDGNTTIVAPESLSETIMDNNDEGCNIDNEVCVYAPDEWFKYTESEFNDLLVKNFPIY